MTLQYKTPMARKEALGYCRRCLAVMLCCVLVFGLTVRTAPRAKAVATEAALAVGSGAFSLNPVGGAIGLVCLAAAGLDIGAGYVHAEDSVFYGTKGYDIGADCWDYLYNLGGDVVGPWCADVYARFTAKGGVAPGDTFEIPPEVAAAIQQWASGNIDFVDGAAVYTQRGLFSDNSQVIFTAYPSGYTWNTVPVSAVSLGSVVPFGESFSFSFFDANGVPWDCKCYIDGNSQCYEFVQDGVSLGSVSCGSNSLFFHLREFSGKCYLCVGILYPSGILQFTGEYWKKVSDLASRYPCIAVENIFDLSTTMTKTPALDEAPTAPLTVTVPATLPTTEVGGYVVPIAETLTGEDVLNPGKEEDLPKPDATAEVWQKLKDWLEQWGQGNKDLIDGKLGEIPGAIDEGINRTLPGAVDQALNDALPGALDNALTDALPATGSKIGDQTVNEAMNDPDSLGAVFISKFPFSIPWDVAKAISLLAAPPVTPRWEVDFLAPMSDMVGGWRGSTAIVLDFGEYPIIGTATRWVSTLMFVYALAMGTKKLIWTA